MKEKKILTLDLNSQITGETLKAIESLAETEKMHFWRKNLNGGLDLITEQ